MPTARAYPSRFVPTGGWTWRVLVAAVFALLAAALAGLWPPAPASQAAGSVPLPFEAGQAVRIIQGYNGGTHQGRSYYGLDLVLAHAETSGAPVLSPIDGRVAWAFAPGEGNGCIGIAMRDADYSVTLCHVIFDRAFSRRESITRGQVLGTVGPPGTVGNNGTPHVHMELHRGGGSSGPVPFSPPEGLLLEGVDLPATGGHNEHGSRPPIVSSNHATAAAPMELASQPEAAPEVFEHCPPGQSPRYGFGFADLNARLGETMGEPLTCEYADPAGTGDVHQVTTGGLAYWRKAHNRPSFTNGSAHWALVEGELLHWLDQAVDPPVDAGPIEAHR